MSDAAKPLPEPDDGGAPEPAVRKKKKKKKKPARSRWPLYAGLGALGVLGLVLTIWVVVKVTRGEPPAQPVTAFERYSTEEKDLGFDYPKGWDVSEYGKQNQRHIEVKGGSAMITMKENLAGSLVGDIAGALGGGKEVPEELTPVAQVHEMRRPKDSSSYREEPAVSVDTRMGKVRRSAYTDGSKRGYRATALMRQTALDVFCECRASDWETLRPAFERVIASLSRGG